MKKIKTYDNYNKLNELDITKYENYMIPSILVMMSNNFKIVEKRLKINDYIVYPVEDFFIPAQIIDLFFNYDVVYYDIIDINGKTCTISYYTNIYEILNNDILEYVKEKIDIVKNTNKYNL